MYPNYPPGSNPPPYGFIPPGDPVPPPTNYPQQYAPPSQPGYASQPGYPQASYPYAGYAAAPAPYGFVPPSHPQAGGAYPPSGYPPAGYPPAAGYPPQQSYEPPMGYSPHPTYPPQGGFAQYTPSGGYPPAAGYPQQNTGGYSAQTGYPPPASYPAQPPGPGTNYGSYGYFTPVQKPEVTDHEKEAFLQLAGADGEIDAFELQEILNKEFTKEFKFDGFSVDMTRSMVAMRDLDMSGKLGFEDYKRLRSDLTLCKTTFQSFDSDRNGYFDKSEFQRAIRMLGLNVSDRMLNGLMMRYSDRAGNIPFNDFVACFIKLKTMLKTFQAKDVYRQGDVEFQRDEFVQLCMYS